MFVLRDAKTTLEWPVFVNTPSNGGVDVCEFTAVFQELDIDEAQALSKQGDVAFMQRILVDWKDVTDQHGKPIALTDEVRKQICKTAYLVEAVVKTYFLMLRGEADSKNLQRS